VDLNDELHVQACAGSMHCCNRRDRIGEENDAAPDIYQELTQYAQNAKIPTLSELLKLHPVYSVRMLTTERRSLSWVVLAGC
jgi:hypothetical protein